MCRCPYCSFPLDLELRAPLNYISKAEYSAEASRKLPTTTSFYVSVASRFLCTYAVSMVHSSTLLWYLHDLDYCCSYSTTSRKDEKLSLACPSSCCGSYNNNNNTLCSPQLHSKWCTPFCCSKGIFSLFFISPTFGFF